jgi:glyoxalase family protein
MGVGTVHHIAWRTHDDNDQLEWQKYIASNGYGVTPVYEQYREQLKRSLIR